MTHRCFRNVRSVRLWLAGLVLIGGAVGEWETASLRADEELSAQLPAERLPEGARVVELRVFPESIELAGPYSYRQVVVLGELDSGETADLTRLVQWDVRSGQVSVSPLGLVRPVQPGWDHVHVRWGDFEREIPCVVTELDATPDVSFVRDVQPALSRMTCNQGTCHGSKDGKNGFKLSLRGYDPLFDHRALTDEIGARRFNRAAPEQSLMLLKATGSIPHVGGVLTQVGHPYYELIKTWIQQGCRLDLDSPRVTSIDVFPRDPVLPRPDMLQQMVVLATYANGEVRDVTHEAFVESGNTEVVAARPGSLLQMLRRGEAPVLVRYEGAYVATTLTVMGDRSGFTWNHPETFNYIDELVYQKLERMKILPSDLCTDDEFLRRVHLDLTGLPPAADEVRQFLADPRDTRVKRDEVVDRLVGSPEFVEFWTNKWADLLQVNRKFLGEEGAIALRNWIKNALAANVPYDRFAHEILTASGSTWENPPAAYYKTMRSPDDLMENTTHLFLAVRFNCNKCHDHPFERWTQDQYYHLAAFFAQVDRKADPRFAGRTIGGSAVEGAKPLVEIVYDTAQGEITHDRTGDVAAPSFPYDLPRDIADELPRRQQLAAWLTAPENPYFARSYVNRLWGYLFGIGIIEPIDDIRAGNPPTNPALLDALTEDFLHSGFDVQHMLRTICKSRTYQHSVAANAWNEDDEINYARALPRRLAAEVLFDAIHAAAGAPPRIPGVPAGFRAAELPDSGVPLPFLDDFGRPPRESACECERSGGVVLGPIMKLVNGPTVAEALTRSDNALTRLVNEKSSDEEVIEEVFLRFLGRFPTEQEVALARETIAQAGQDLTALQEALAEYEQQLPAKIASWEQGLQAAAWKPLFPDHASSTVGATLTLQDDGSIVARGEPGQDVYQIIARTELSGITAIRLEALPDASLSAGGPGRAANGNFVLNEFRVRIAPVGDEDNARTVTLQNASADFSQNGWPVAGAIDGNSATGWAIMPEFGKPHVAIFEIREDLAGSGPQQLTFELDQQFGDGRHSLGRFRLSVTTTPRPVRYQSLPEELAAALAVPPDDRSEPQWQRIREHYLAQDPIWQQHKQAVELGERLLRDQRLVGIQDLGWALLNTPAFLFNR
jgi:hypothetical protein